ncbi:MAG: TonB family protein [candidate division NC10 bacterium]|nr:TonB family protein [candidate division NC10 bacterium]
MAAVLDRLLAPGPQPREVCLTFGLSVLFHGLLTLVIVLVPRFQVGTYITVPVSYTVNLVEAPPGGRGAASPSPAPTVGPAPAAPRPAPAPAARPAPVPRSAPTEELTLPGRRPVRKATPDREPSLRPPSVTGREAARPTPPGPVPLTPAVPAVPTPAPPVASADAGAGKGSGVEVAGTASGAGGGSALASYLTLVDWKIQQNWVPLGASGPTETVVVVRFRVLRSGQVRDLELETSSGNASLDTSALRAVRQSLPLPPFPNLLTEPSLDLRYRFVMERG